MSVQPSVDRRTFDRRLFAVAAILFPLIIFIGFAPTYYLKGFFGSPPLPSLVTHIHGIVMTAWVVLFIVQVWLISARRVKTHQKLGYAAIVLAIPVLVSGFFAAVRAAKFGSTGAPPNIPRLNFMLVPMTDLIMFVIFFGAAIYFRKKPVEHKRLMLMTAINFVPPALARIQIPSLQALGPLWFFGLPTILALIVLIVDSKRNRKVNKVFLTGVLLLIVSYVARLALMGTATWIQFAAWLTTWAA